MNNQPLKFVTSYLRARRLSIADVQSGEQKRVLHNLDQSAHMAISQ